jgi:hypothetical protein
MTVDYRKLNQVVALIAAAVADALSFLEPTCTVTHFLQQGGVVNTPISTSPHLLIMPLPMGQAYSNHHNMYKQGNKTRERSGFLLYMKVGALKT